jgi:hypothetical protein
LIGNERRKENERMITRGETGRKEISNMEITIESMKLTNKSKQKTTPMSPTSNLSMNTTQIQIHLIDNYILNYNNIVHTKISRCVKQLTIRVCER